MSPAAVIGLLIAVGTVVKESMENDSDCDC